MPWDQYGQPIGEDSDHPLITAAIDAIAGFGATLTGSDGDSVATSTGSILFGGGYAAYGAAAGDKYWITI